LSPPSPQETIAGYCSAKLYQMSDFDQTYDNESLVLGDQIIQGTCMLGNAFGEVESASVKRTADKEEIEGCSGALRAFFLKKPRFELKLETLFANGVDAPGLMDKIALPLVGVFARVVDIEVKWAKGKSRMLSIDATSWDSLADADAYRYNSTTGVFTPIDPAE